MTRVGSHSTFIAFNPNNQNKNKCIQLTDSDVIKSTERCYALKYDWNEHFASDFL